MRISQIANSGTVYLQLSKQVELNFLLGHLDKPKILPTNFDMNCILIT